MNSVCGKPTRFKWGLIELLVVVAIISMLLALLLPAVSRLIAVLRRAIKILVKMLTQESVSSYVCERVQAYTGCVFVSCGKCTSTPFPILKAERLCLGGSRELGESISPVQYWINGRDKNGWVGRDPEKDSLLLA